MAEENGVSFRLPRGALWLLAVAVLGPWLLLAGGWWRERAETPRPRHVPGAPVHKGAAPEPMVSAGPWGQLAYSRILLEPPEDFIPTDLSQIELRPWVFKGYSAGALEELWTAAGLSSEQLATVRDAARREVTPEAIVIKPTRELIVDLQPEARAKIYLALADFPENYGQYNPYRLRANLAEEWLKQSDLPAEAVALTRKLLYPRGVALCFSDEAVVLPTISDRAARARYIKTMSRKSALMVRLRIAPQQDVASLVEYWGVGGRRKDLKPILESIARQPNGGEIDIVHLIPRFARMLVYTYPAPSSHAVDATHDCHWTSFNFRNDAPDEQFSDIEQVRRTLQERYFPVIGEPKLGDILMFVRPDGVVTHSCVYIADDVVFTKNGPAFSVPWVLSTVQDVQAFYAGQGVEIRRFRAQGVE